MVDSETREAGLAAHTDDAATPASGALPDFSTQGRFAPAFKAELRDIGERRGNDDPDGPFPLPAFELDRTSDVLDGLLDELRNEEQERLWQDAAKNGECKVGLTGLALSGGGIRSSTFNLGVTQALDRIGLFKHLDYLSTVSGGGYIGTYLSTCMLRDREEKEAPVYPLRHQTGTEESDRLRHLRNHASYLQPGGKSDLLAIPIVLLRGIAVNLMFIVPLLIFVAIAFHWAMESGAPPYQFRWTTDLMARGMPRTVATLPLTLAAVATLLVAFAFYPLVSRVGQRLARRSEDDEDERRRLRSYWIEYLTKVLSVGFVALLIEVQPVLLGLIARFEASLGTGLGGWTAVIGGGSAVSALLANNLIASFQRIWARFGLALIGIVALLGLWMLLLWITLRLHTAGSTGEAWPVELILIVSIAFFAYSFLFTDVNFTSIHKFYRDRLVGAFVAQASTDTADTGEVPNLSALDTTRAPYHLINAALNVERADVRYRSGRKASFFFFGKRYCGGIRTGYCPTRLLESIAEDLDVGTAMAISGAAVAPRMGKSTNRALTFIMGLLNVRLNYWLPNPRKLHDAGDARREAINQWRLWLWKPGPLYLLREMIWGLSESNSYVNLSDGGHIENLGIYELLRRQCRFIIAGDGECDPDLSLGGLTEVIRMARIDFGFQVEMEGLDELRNGLQQYAIGRIRYGEDRTGILLYLKSNLGGDYNLEATLDETCYRTSPERDDDRLYDENAYVAYYRQLHPDFPHESTADQFFDESQFESYRALGYQVAASALIAPWRPPEPEEKETA